MQPSLRHDPEAVSEQFLDQVHTKNRHHVDDGLFKMPKSRIGGHLAPNLYVVLLQLHSLTSWSVVGWEID